MPPHLALTEQAVAYVRYALANPALFRLMFGPRQAYARPELMAASEAAYAVLSNRVADQTLPGGDREAVALACWSMVHGLASLFLDGRISEKTSAPDDSLVRRVTGALLRHGDAEPTPPKHSPHLVDTPEMPAQL